MRMEHFIKQLKTNEKIYSGLIQLDDIKSTKNFNKLVECEFFKEKKDDYDYIKKHLNVDNKTLNFNVYPKKDKYGTQNPINTTYNFISEHPNSSFTGIYELTEYNDVNSEHPNNNNYIENIILNSNNNNNYSLGIHYENILFNPDIRYDFLKQRTEDIDLLINQSKIIKTKGNMSKKPNDLTYISQYDLENTRLSALKGSLMLPNSTTKSKLMKRKDTKWNMNTLKDFTRFNKKLYKLIKSRGDFDVSLDDIISIILNNNYMYYDDIIILDFGCKHIKGLPYSNNVWDRPTNVFKRESTIKLGYPLNKEIGYVFENNQEKHPYIIDKLFAETED